MKTDARVDKITKLHNAQHDFAREAAMRLLREATPRILDALRQWEQTRRRWSASYIAGMRMMSGGKT
jgi:hypothetical protein